MAPDAPNDPEPEAVVPVGETAAEPEAPAAPAEPAAPPSPAKEWAVAVALMLLFALIAFQFISFLRN
jgi:hypothetical protein